ncbi:MAG: type VII secretion protein EssC [Ruminiclostridium sp.]|nr:type VII secretion protein EssC [Ruminiclostridium sp.]
MLLTLLKNDSSNSIVLPEKISGRYPITHNGRNGAETLLVVEAEGDMWKLRSGIRSKIIDGENELHDITLAAGSITTIRINETEETAFLVAESINNTDMMFKKVIMNKPCSFVIGTSNSCDIYINTGYSKKAQIELVYDTNTGFKITNFFQGVGVYQNQVKPQIGCLGIGDVISIINTRFVFGKGFIAFDHSKDIVINNNTLFGTFINEKPIKERVYFFDEEYSQGLFFCSPRFKKELETSEISIEYPPTSQMNNRVPAALTLGPSITMGMSSAATAAFTVTNQLSNGGSIMTVMPSVIMASSMLLSSLLWPVVTKTYEKRLRKKAERNRMIKYRDYLNEQNRYLDSLIVKQKEIINENNPKLPVLAERIEKRDRSLWERMYGQSDFLNISVGSGSVPLKLQIKQSADKFELEEDVLRDEANKFLARSTSIDDAPVEVSLIKDRIAGIIGKRANVTEYIKSWILQLVSLYSYDDLGLVIIYDEAEKEIWDHYRWLPHIWNDDSTVRMIASDADELRVISSEIEKIRSAGTKGSERRYILICASRSLALKTEFVGKLIKDGDGSRFSIVALYDSMNYLPKECSLVLEISDSTANVYRMGADTTQQIKLDSTVGIDMPKLSVALANINLARNNEVFELPPSYKFLEMFNVTKAEHLNCLQRWKDSNPVETLKVPIGINSHGDMSMLDVHEKYHGPHGLIAGMTGSGKSEFIMTMILSMAVNYHPYEVSFVLIDYKGGGMANAFIGMPHLAGTITNLDGASMTRSMEAIQAELSRRQKVFGEVESTLNISPMNIYKYQMLYREGRVSEPMPHLMIISDEFAELKAQQPDFMANLVSAARIGRSLGVHLILATQKPSGVVDPQIWSNSKFKICLKVQDAPDSNEMLKKPDAADLVEVGRYYLQVGNDEYFELAQSAWCGADYDADGTASDNKASYITFVDKIGRTIAQANDTFVSKSDKSHNNLNQLKAIINYIKALAETENIHTQPLWLEPVPAIIILEDLIKKYQYNQPTTRFVAVVGEYDIPDKQEQKLLTYDLEEAGNIQIYGSSGVGKTDFLTTMTYSLASRYSPNDVWIYILDFDSQTTRYLTRLNHVGEVMIPDDDEKISHFFAWIKGEIRRRRKILSESSGDYYNYVDNGGIMPWIVIMIHNLGSFSEAYPDYEEMLVSLTRGSTKYGISFVITATAVNMVRFRIAQNFKTTIAMQLNDNSYSSIIDGVRRKTPSAIKGRGLTVIEGINEFQTAYVADPENADSIKQAIEKFANELNVKYPNNKAYRIPILPDVYTSVIAEDYYNASNRELVPVGMDIHKVEPIYINTDVPFILIPAIRGRKPFFLQGLSEFIAANVADRVIVYNKDADFSDNAAAEYEYYTQDDDFITIIDELSLESKARTFVIIKRLGDAITKSAFDLQMKLKKLLSLVETGQTRITVVAYDNDDGFGSYFSSSWCSSLVASENYIWEGDGYYDQNRFKHPYVSKPDYVKLGGYVVSNGEITCVRLLASEVSEIEE